MDPSYCGVITSDAVNKPRSFIEDPSWPWNGADGTRTSSHLDLGMKYNSFNESTFLLLEFSKMTYLQGTIQRIILWDAESEELKVYRTYEIETKFVWDFEWISATRLALCTFEGVIYVFHIGRNTPIRILSHVWQISTEDSCAISKRRSFQVGVCKIAWNSGWNFLVSGSLDGSLKVFVASKLKKKTGTNSTPLAQMWSIDNPTQALYQCQLGSKVYCIDCLYLGKGTDKSKSSLIAW